MDAAFWITTLIVVATPGTGAVSTPITSVLANTFSAPLTTASSRIAVPVARESTTLTLGVR